MATNHLVSCNVSCNDFSFVKNIKGCKVPRLNNLDFNTRFGTINTLNLSHPTKIKNSNKKLLYEGIEIMYSSHHQR